MPTDPRPTQLLDQVRHLLGEVDIALREAPSDAFAFAGAMRTLRSFLRDAERAATVAIDVLPSGTA